ncbi:hypothetical protein [Paracidovorax sp. MALMAid1276]|uniref:hypothetical protein n=1 Tax=Paracidovorax sp. MALMAid1276 TaxID=3411631 RepID=UPI003B9CE84B
MASERTRLVVERLTWVFIYGGLLTLVLGLATSRQDAAMGWWLTVGGGLATAAGVALIALRARMQSGPRP